MGDSASFQYTTFVDSQGTVLIRPIIPIRLSHTQPTITAEALLDTGADVNLLPYRLGLELGLTWEDQNPVPQVSGNLARSEARAVILNVSVSSFEPRRMLFIWVKTDAARLLLGQINFFKEFDVCFFASEGFFELRPKS